MWEALYLDKSLRTERTALSKTVVCAGGTTPGQKHRKKGDDGRNQMKLALQRTAAQSSALARQNGSMHDWMKSPKGFAAAR